MSNFRLIERQIKPWNSNELETEYVVQEFRHPYGMAWYAPNEWCDVNRFSKKELAEAYLKKAVEQEEEHERRLANWTPPIKEPIKRVRKPLFEDDDRVLVPCIGVRITSSLDYRTRSNDR